MNLLFGLISSGIVGTLIFGILVLLRPITEKLLSKSWHYYKLFVPLFFLLGGTLLTGNLIYHTQQLIAKISDTYTQAPIYAETTPYAFNVPISPTFGDSVFLNYENNEIIIPSDIQLVAGHMLNHFSRLAPLVIAVWAVGVLMFLSINFVKYLQYRRLVLQHSKVYKKIDCTIPIVISNIAHTPMLIGLIKPIIILPKINFEDVEIEIIIKHELVHYKRKDLLFKMLGLIANAIHWYNPAVYILNRQINTFCELSCDEKVASEMDIHYRRFYGEMILQVMQYSTIKRSLIGNLMFATNFSNSKKIIKRRLISIMNGKKMNKNAVVLALIIGVLVVGGGFAISHLLDSVVPVYATTSDAPDLAPIPIYYDGEVVGFEAHPDAETVIVEADPLIFTYGHEMFDTIYQEMGNIMWPTYLPEGFTLLEVGIMHPRDSFPELFTDDCYKHLNDLSVIFANGENTILLSVRHFEPYTGHREEGGIRRLTIDDLSTLNYSERHITVNGMNATIGRYAGIIISDIDNGTSYQLLPSIDAPVSEEELIRMAASLKYILDLM